jgi:hypothetical protein
VTMIRADAFLLAVQAIRPPSSHSR